MSELADLIPFAQFEEEMRGTSRELSPQIAAVLRDFKWGPYQPTKNAWMAAQDAFRCAEFDRIERERPPVVRLRHSSGCEVFHVADWSKVARQ